jgi:hypothetical protein
MLTIQPTILDPPAAITQKISSPSLSSSLSSSSPSSCSQSTPSSEDDLSNSSLSSGPATPPNLHQNTIDPDAQWLVQKFGGTSVGKFAVRIAEDIVVYAFSLLHFVVLQSDRIY